MSDVDDAFEAAAAHLEFYRAQHADAVRKRLCTGCKWYDTYRHANIYGDVLCHHPKAGHSLADGRATSGTVEQRSRWFFGCGASGKWWEEKK